jgi:hypothetical protein
LLPSGSQQIVEVTDFHGGELSRFHPKADHHA